MSDKVKYNTEKVKITYKGETRNIPKRYLPDTLKGKDRQKQIKSIFEEKDRPKTKVKERKSSWTTQFDKKYGKELDEMKGKRSKKNIRKEKVRIIVQVQDLTKPQVVGREGVCMRILWEERRLEKRMKI